MRSCRVGKRRYATYRNHTWVLCAYGESPYLEECIRSLINQTVGSKILIATSTPNDEINRLAGKYDLPVFVNTGASGITRDWNFALSCATTRYVTIAHQDDVYESIYLERALRGLSGARHPLIFFSDYYEIRDGRKVVSNRNLRIKRMMLLPLRSRLLQNSVFVRRRILSLGSPIDCPSVTYVMPNLQSIQNHQGNLNKQNQEGQQNKSEGEGLLFDPAYRVAQDWEAWERISRMEGTFVFDPYLLMGHRIHEASTTTELIADQTRTKEEMSIFRRFWPAWMAKRIERWYRKGQDSNRIG